MSLILLRLCMGYFDSMGDCVWYEGNWSFKEKTGCAACYLADVENILDFGVLIGFTELAFRCRWLRMIVLLADYRKNIEDISHRFDLLFPIKRLDGLVLKITKDISFVKYKLFIAAF